MMKISALATPHQPLTWERLQMLWQNRFYLMQHIDLETNERVLEIFSDSRLKAEFPNHWEHLRKLSEITSYAYTDTHMIAVEVVNDGRVFNY